MSHVKHIVLDEADTLIEESFWDEVRPLVVRQRRHQDWTISHAPPVHAQGPPERTAVAACGTVLYTTERWE